MTLNQVAILVILAATVGTFLFGRWRHDVVAPASLLACVAAGLLPDGEAFSGFAHPEVITVGCVLVLSRGCNSATIGKSDFRWKFWSWP